METHHAKLYSRNRRFIKLYLTKAEKNVDKPSASDEQRRLLQQIRKLMEANHGILEKEQIFKWTKQNSGKNSWGE